MQISITANEKYDKLRNSLDDKISKSLYETWKAKIGDDSYLEQRLSNHLLIKSEKVSYEHFGSNNPLFAKPDKQDLIESNFDKFLLKTLSEVAYWQKLSAVITISQSITNLLEKRETLRITRESVMLIVREYNAIINALGSRQDHRLF